MNEAVRDQFGVWHVCYSIHSSKEELEWALQLLVPRWAISTTPSFPASVNTSASEVGAWMVGSCLGGRRGSAIGGGSAAGTFRMSFGKKTFSALLSLESVGTFA